MPHQSMILEIDGESVRADVKRTATGPLRAEIPWRDVPPQVTLDGAPYAVQSQRALNARRERLVLVLLPAPDEPKPKARKGRGDG